MVDVASVVVGVFLDQEAQNIQRHIASAYQNDVLAQCGEDIGFAPEGIQGVDDVSRGEDSLEFFAFDLELTGVRASGGQDDYIKMCLEVIDGHFCADFDVAGKLDVVFGKQAIELSSDRFGLLMVGCYTVADQTVRCRQLIEDGDDIIGAFSVDRLCKKKTAGTRADNSDLQGCSCLHGASFRSHRRRRNDDHVLNHLVLNHYLKNPVLQLTGQKLLDVYLL